MSENEWEKVKQKSIKREAFDNACVICKDDFRLEDQVLLSCTHVFHRVLCCKITSIYKTKFLIILSENKLSYQFSQSFKINIFKSSKKYCLLCSKLFSILTKCT